jgi:hypothetical protein
MGKLCKIRLGNGAKGEGMEIRKWGITISNKNEIN